MTQPAAPQSAGPPEPRRGLRDSTRGRILLLGLALLAALVVARTCGSTEKNVSQEEAIEIASERAGFEPCAAEPCRQIRYVQRGIPVRAYWAVVLSDELDPEGQPNRIASYLIDVTTGDVSMP